MPRRVVCTGYCTGGALAGIAAVWAGHNLAGRGCALHHIWRTPVSSKVSARACPAYLGLAQSCMLGCSARSSTMIVLSPTHGCDGSHCYSAWCVAFPISSEAQTVDSQCKCLHNRRELQA